MNQLVVAALQEGGVDRHHWFHAFAGHTGGQRDRVLFSNGDVEVTLGIGLREANQIRAFAHSGGNAHEAWIGGGHIAQPVAEHVAILFLGGVLRRTGGRCLLHQRSADGRGGFFQLSNRVIANLVGFGGQEAFPFDRFDMQELRAFLVAQVTQRLSQRL